MCTEPLPDLEQQTFYLLHLKTHPRFFRNQKKHNQSCVFQN